MNEKENKQKTGLRPGQLLRFLIFLGIFLLLFVRVSDILEFKSLAPPWNMTLKVGGFYNEPKDSMDVMFFGSSHMYCSIDPALFQEETGLTSYVFATQSQPLWITYHYIREALKRQSPHTIFLEIHMASFLEEYEDEGTNYSAIDPIPFSLNKLEMIRASVPSGQRHEYVFNIIKYHSRYNELTPQDYDLSFKKETDPERGYVRLTQAASDEDWDRVYRSVDHVAASASPGEKNLFYLRKIIELAREENLRLILFKAPSNPTEEEQMIYRYVADLCRQEGLEFGNFNSDAHMQAIGLDTETDFYDRRHLNTSGVAKFVPYFADYFHLSKAGE